jgi:hypothetical protein
MFELLLFLLLPVAQWYRASNGENQIHEFEGSATYSLLYSTTHFSSTILTTLYFLIQ